MLGVSAYALTFTAFLQHGPVRILFLYGGLQCTDR